MTIVLLVAVAAVAAIGVVGVARRGLSDERSSVRDYQQTLDTLRHLSDHRATTPPGLATRSDQVPPDPTTGAGAGPTASSSPTPSPSTRTRSRSDMLAPASSPDLTTPADPPCRPFTPEDAPVTADRPLRSASVSAAPLTRSPRSVTVTTAADAVRQLAATRAMYGPRPTRPALPTSTRRRDRRPLIATAAAVVVVGTLTGVAVALRPPARPGSSSPPAHTQAAPAVHNSHPAATHQPTETPSPASTHVTTDLVPVTASTTEATYDVTGAPFSVSLAARGPCWVEAVDTATGQVLWEGTLQAGQIQTVPATAGLFLRLGNAPDVTVSEGGQAVQLPSGHDIVFDLTFVTT